MELQTKIIVIFDFLYYDDAAQLVCFSFNFIFCIRDRDNVGNNKDIDDNNDIGLRILITNSVKLILHRRYH
jgi:hypothetical protein